MQPAAQSTQPLGVIPLDKPAGLSSARAVSRVKRLIPRGTKIGHAGTLDPFATGVLLLLVGKATRWCERLMDCRKQYEATIKLGATTATLDPEAPEEFTSTASIPAAADIEQRLAAMTGDIMQTPPIFSAMKIGGHRAYDLARKGLEVKLEPRLVRIYEITMLSCQWPLVRVRIDCGRGTYIRAIARDLGQSLGVGGYLTELRRTRVGPFWEKDTVSIDQLNEDGIGPHLRQIDLAGDP
jgi:tRNA pseudouridine55 synthase